MVVRLCAPCDWLAGSSVLTEDSWQKVSRHARDPGEDKAHQKPDGWIETFVEVCGSRWTSILRFSIAL